jgi:hypothetical protein
METAMTNESEPKIQLPSLPVTEVNLLLDGLKHLPFGQVNDLFHRIRNSAQVQIDEWKAKQLPVHANGEPRTNDERLA